MSGGVDLTPGRAQRLRDAVRSAYSAAAEHPLDKHAFPVGRVLAEGLGYPPALLDTLPAISVDAFAGVSNLSVFAEIPAGARVLDLGCGAGLDSLIAARRVGAGGHVIGVDFSEAMLARAHEATAEAAIAVTLFRADAERLPLAGGSIDVALVNGIFNLNPARTEIFRELTRVVRPGGRAYAAELIAREAASDTGEFDETAWFA
ncbi:MAG: methyltransferase domain-containing protein [Candidatus Rokuibacteriota bacterium]